MKTSTETQRYSLNGETMGTRYTALFYAEAGLDTDDVGRLIRISYGPFQLGSLVRGGVEEVQGKVLREQLGNRAANALRGARHQGDLACETRRKRHRRSSHAAG